MKIGETAHYELMTMEIYTRALRCIVRPGRTAFKVTPKQGVDGGGLDAVRKLRLVILAGVVLASGTVLRLLDLAGVGPLPDLPGIAAVIVPLLGLIELRRVLRTLLAVGRRQQRRQVYRFEGEAPAHCFADGGHIGGHLVDASAAGVGLVLDAPVDVGERPAVLLELEEATGRGARGRRPGRGPLLPRGRGPLSGRGDDRGDGPGLADAADGVVLRRLQPRAPARPPSGRPGGPRGDRHAARRPRPGAESEEGLRSGLAAVNAVRRDWRR